MLRALRGVRVVQPRLTGMGFAPCVSSADLIPVTWCEGKPQGRQKEKLERMCNTLERQVRENPTSSNLHLAALTRLVFFADREAQVERALTYLQEALDLESEPSRRARLLADVSGAHLVLAERTQSAVELAAALEASLHAIELEPGQPEATFNHQLGLHLLGVELGAPDTDEPWRAELERRLPPPELPPTRKPCGPQKELRLALDSWAASPSIGGLFELVLGQACWQGQEDRFYADVFSAAQRDPRLAARSWRTHRAAQAALAEFQPTAAAGSLRELRGLSPPEPIRLAGQLQDAIVSFYDNDYTRASARLDSLASEARQTSYFELAALASRMGALIAEVQGDYGRALELAHAALDAARRSASPETEAEVRTVWIELLEKVGREEEAWVGVIEVLRHLETRQQPKVRVAALRMAADLAHSRGFDRVALALHDRSVALTAELAPESKAAALQLRSELLAKLGHTDRAWEDLTLARNLVQVEVSDEAVRGTLEDDLLLLEGTSAGEETARRAALVEAVGRYRAAGYGHRILDAQLQLARVEKASGDPSSARTNLEAALAELSVQVTRVPTWREATALVAAARPLVDELIGLQLESDPPRAILQTLASYFGLRTKSPGAQRPGELPNSMQRLTTFVRDDELVLLFEAGGIVRLERSRVDRIELLQLRERLLRQLSSSSPESRLETTTGRLSSLVLAPFLEQLVPEKTLVVFADDVLAGLPFNLLPVGTGGEILIDRFDVHYSSTLEPPIAVGALHSMLVVGISKGPQGLPPLPGAITEARGIARLYTASTLLRDEQAQPEPILAELEAKEGAHLAGHFVVNTRSPLDSFLVLLEPTSENPGKLPLSAILGTPKPRLRLLVFSTCDTGRGLPRAPHGLASLANAISEAQTRSSVLALWPVADEPGGRIAVAMHQHLQAGRSLAAALRLAQLGHRDGHPGSWAALAAFD